MAKRGQTYPYRVRYVWTTGIKGVDVASDLDEARIKANRIEGYGLRRDDADVEVTIIRIDLYVTGRTATVVETRNTAVR